MCGLSSEFLLRFLLLNLVYFENNFVTCEELPDAVFNSNIRKYSVKEDDTNATDLKTLQKAEVGRYASFAPIRNPIRFKEIPDNAISSSSYGRGLLHHEHAGHEGYGLHDGFYADGSHYGHGYDYIHGDDHHDFDHHEDHHEDHHSHGDHFGHHHSGHGHHHSGHGHHHSGHGHHHLDHGHHHKHHDHHHLATKALLWPIAGIALLGAAAALVTNPVLLQLGVVSGRRRRRDTVEVSGPDFYSDKSWPLNPYGNKEKDDIKNTKEGIAAGKVQREKKVSQFPGHVKPKRQVNNRFIPIPLKLKGD